MTTTTYLPPAMYLSDTNANTIVRIVNDKITKVTFYKNQNGKVLASIDNNTLSHEDFQKIKSIYPLASSHEAFHGHIRKILKHFRKNLLEPIAA